MSLGPTSARHVVRATLAGVGLITLVAGATGSALADDSRQARHGSPTSSVYLVQGVPKMDVSVWIDGDRVATGLKPAQVSAPLSLRQGEHRATFSAPGWRISSTFTVDSRSADVVLHWPADKAKTPEVTVFANDLQKLAVGKARISVAHTAVVPPADVRVDGQVMFANIANAEYVTQTVPPGTYSVDIVPTGENDNPFFGPVDLAVQPNVLTRVFAIGEPKNGTMTAVVQTLPVSSSGSPAPSLVDSGSAGLVAPGLGLGGAGVRSPFAGHVGSSVLILGLATAVVVLVGSKRARRRVTTGGREH
jgi:Domain of unknown function (DUF4397)